jgi:hypothetical protein
MTFNRGDTVVQIVTPITGRVTGWSIDQETGTRQVGVEWTDSDGTLHSRFFNEDQIQLANAAPAA